MIVLVALSRLAEMPIARVIWNYTNVLHLKMIEQHESLQDTAEPDLLCKWAFAQASYWSKFAALSRASPLPLWSLGCGRRFQESAGFRLTEVGDQIVAVDVLPDMRDAELSISKRETMYAA
jgi:hypothetical protein